MEGRLQIRSYEDKNGIRRKVAEVISWRVEFLQRLKKSFGEETVEEKVENEINKVSLNGEEIESKENLNLEE